MPRWELGDEAVRGDGFLGPEESPHQSRERSRPLSSLRFSQSSGFRIRRRADIAVPALCEPDAVMGREEEDVSLARL